MYLTSPGPSRWLPGDRIRLLSPGSEGGLFGALIGHDIMWAGRAADGTEWAIHKSKDRGAEFVVLDDVAAGRAMLNYGSDARSLEEGEAMVAAAATRLGEPWTPLLHCRELVSSAQSAVSRYRV